MIADYTDIRELKTFEKYGDVFTQERFNPETLMYLYKRSKKDDPTRISFEVVKAVRRKPSPNEEVFSYPSTSEWGKYGFTVCNNRYAEAIINYLMENGPTTPEERYEFKKKLIKQ